MNTPVSSMLLVFVASIFGSVGAVFLKMGAEKLRGGIHRLISVQSASGVALFLISSVFFGAGIKNGQLSILYPMVSLNNVWSLIWGRLFFREELTKQKFVALGLILFGIALIAAAR